MLGTRSITERLSHLLLHLVELYGVKDPDGILIGAAFTHADLAHMVGATRQWVTISLKRLHDKNVLVVRKSKIIVRRIDVLQEMRGQERLTCLQRQRLLIKTAQELSSEPLRATNRRSPSNENCCEQTHSPKMPGRDRNAQVQQPLRGLIMSRNLGRKLVAFVVAAAAVHGWTSAAGAQTVVNDRYRHAGHHHQHGDGRHHRPSAQAAGEIPAEGRQIRQHQVRIRVEQLHLGPAGHQRHDGEQASVRHDGRLSAGGERLHVSRAIRKARAG